VIPRFAGIRRCHSFAISNITETTEYPEKPLEFIFTVLAKTLNSSSLKSPWLILGVFSFLCQSRILVLTVVNRQPMTRNWWLTL